MQLAMPSLAVVLEGPRTKNGRRVFEAFKEANMQSYWNRELVEAAEAIVYMGFMRPGTLFIAAKPSHIQTIKNAWSRRILKTPDDYRIISLGDMGAIQPIEQMHYVPLGDVVCDAVAHLNRLSQSATVSSVQRHVSQTCSHVAPPSVEMVRQTVSNLTATGILYRMGDHLFVSVPTKSPVKEKQTVECQTGMSIMEHEPEKKDRRGFIARLFARKSPPAPVPSPNTQPIAFSTEFPPPHWMSVACAASRQPQTMNIVNFGQQTKYPTYNERLCDVAEVPQVKRTARKQRKCDRIRQLSSSSECLNYGPIDPPECLPGKVEVISEVKTTRRRRRHATTERHRDREPVRTSTPVPGSDSAYSPSPVTDSNEEAGLGGSWSEPEDYNKMPDHTYVNLKLHESTMYEEFSSAQLPPMVHISNV